MSASLPLRNSCRISLARDATGHIVVNEQGRTSAPLIFAVGRRSGRSTALHRRRDRRRPESGQGDRGGAQAIAVRRTGMRDHQPDLGLAAAGGAKVALKPVNWATDAIALVSNSKPNARELLCPASATSSAHSERSTISTSFPRTAPASRRRTICFRRSPRSIAVPSSP